MNGLSSFAPPTLENQQNQFLSQFLDYESCPFCQRSFFRGKLAYHLKLCSQDNPMSKNNKPSLREKHKKNSLSAATNYERCEFCKSRIPVFMLPRHQEHCRKGPEDRNMSFGHFEKAQRKSKMVAKGSTDQIPEDTIFPRIKQYGPKGTDTSKEALPNSKKQGRSLNRSTVQSIKIREQLRCFRRAEEVQKVQCEFCGRKFAQKAALRHVPICSMLRKKEQQEIVMAKKSRSYGGNNKSTKVQISKTVDMINLKETHSILLQEPKKQDGVMQTKGICLEEAQSQGGCELEVGIQEERSQQKTHRGEGDPTDKRPSQQKIKEKEQAIRQCP